MELSAYKLARQTFQDEYIRIVVESEPVESPTVSITHKDIFSIYTKDSNGKFTDLRASYPTENGRDGRFFYKERNGIKKTTVFAGYEGQKRIYRTILAAFDQGNKV